MPGNMNKMGKIGVLKRRSDFLRVARDGDKWVSKTIILQTCPNDGKGTRFGITVSKKASKLAVDRNRIKRRLRAAAHEVLPTKARKNTDYVLIGRAQTKSAEYKKIINDLKWCIKRLNDKYKC